MPQPLYPCLWFDGKAAEAAAHYCAIFPGSRILSENPMVVMFELNGQKYMGLNGGPQYQFNEAVSFVINCDNQEEIDHYWNALTAGGSEGKCGWLKDQYGVSWQVVPSILGDLMSDSAKRDRTMKAFMQMKKFDIDKLIEGA